MTLLVLGTRRVLIEACLLDISSSGMHVRSPTQLACDTQVKIQREDVQMLGTVCRCDAQEGGYTIGIQISDPMSSLIELELLNRALIGSEPVVQVESPSESHGEKNPGSKSK